VGAEGTEGTEGWWLNKKNKGLEATKKGHLFGF
jgi:hypothetical protein